MLVFLLEYLSSHHDILMLRFLFIFNAVVIHFYEAVHIFTKECCIIYSTV